MAVVVVGIGDCKVSSDPADILVTHALGSCVAVALYDPLVHVAGLLHFMLPDSTLDAERSRDVPYRFADTGIALLLESACKRGAAKSRLIVVAAGGAQILDSASPFNIGQRNCEAMQRIFAEAGIGIYRAEMGGTSSRTISIDVAHGRVQLRIPGQAGPYVLAGRNPCFQ